MDGWGVIGVAIFLEDSLSEEYDGRIDWASFAAKIRRLAENIESE